MMEGLIQLNTEASAEDWSRCFLSNLLQAPFMYERLWVTRDRAVLEGLPQAEVAFLVEPQRKVFNDYLWDEQGWDILFFAGHSNTDADEMIGQIYP